ncbi:septum formation protein Maf [Xaviernesmea oryzae]|uniref:7-methyl-GTP pyrophosphatase n=1 Tax=Xaviernesmea oryzae TaxID=464029 RepID=A0A1Q9AY87_9HYPH|nr:Maf-like protein [Xaviernesmea oryzae]OLP60406.1 septum formation protein Maf [Xaviernesmea oryzae]SEK19766.1 septum formation protein [Xaviernesmea oryzae]
MAEPLLLASASPFRRKLLENAGLTISWMAADIDERALEAPLSAAGIEPDKLAQALADAKAVAVSARHPDALVIGGDQTLSLGERVFHKARSREEARRHLQTFAGKTHRLNSALTLAKKGEVVWRHISVAEMTMRPLSDAFIERYLDRVGEAVYLSVGAYQLEGEGVQLFDQIEGDYFTVLGLPLLPLLSALRARGSIDG